MKQRVVVIGHGFSSRLGMVRSLGKAKYEVDVVVVSSSSRHAGRRKLKPIDCYSRYVNRWMSCPARTADELVQFLLKECACDGQKAVLVPLGDQEAAAIDLHQELLAPHFLFPHIRREQGAVVRMMDKTRQKELASACGLRVAECRTVHVQGGRFELPSDVPFPAFLKPLATINGAKRGMRRCENAAELRTAIEAMVVRHPDMDVMAEAFRTIQTEYAVVGFSDGTDVVIPGVIEILSMAGGGHFGVARNGRILPPAGFEALIGRFKDFVLRTGFVGLFDIDFYLSGNEFYFGEMNLRFGGSGYAFTASGINLPDRMVRFLAGMPAVAPASSVVKPSVFCNERMCLDDWSNGYISRKEMYAMIRKADILFVSDITDVRPQRALARVLLSRWYRRQVRRLRDWLRHTASRILLASPSWALDLVIDMD